VPIAPGSKTRSACASLSSLPDHRTLAIPANKSSSVDVLIAYVPRAVGEFLILTHFIHRSLHEYRDETSTSIFDVTRYG
jgi:hypothetical protein